MTGRLPENLQEKLSLRLRYYEDIGIREFFRDRIIGPAHLEAQLQQVTSQTLVTVNDESTEMMNEPAAQQPLITTIPKIGEGTLQTVREDIGDCIRCKLHKGRTKIVFGDGHAQAKLLFIGEGPGRDEDLQGLPFVGRAGKLLTQMIEAMGLRRGDVYICNVVKCRPPENRAPEKDEVAACSPFLFRQIDLVAPKVIVCLGSIAAQTILETTRGISQFRGQWLEFRGRKLMATYHPAYLLRNPAAKSEVWKDLQKVMAELGLEVKKKSAQTQA
jgi:uracil-DNA glycosylase family 4